MAKAAFIKKKTLLTSKLNISSRKKLVKCYILEHRFVRCLNTDTAETINT